MIRFSFLLIGLLMLNLNYHYSQFFFVASASAAPIQWQVSVGGNDHWYLAVHRPDGIDWDQANAHVHRFGDDAHLVTITSSAENRFVFSLVNYRKFWFDASGAVRQGPWLGALQAAGSQEPGRGWQWVTGEPFSYANWAVGEPNNAAGGQNEDVLQFFGVPTGVIGSGWNDIVRSGYLFRPQLGYIVESPTTIVPLPGALAAFTTAILLLTYLRLPGHPKLWKARCGNRRSA